MVFLRSDQTKSESVDTEKGSKSNLFSLLKEHDSHGKPLKKVRGIILCHWQGLCCNS